VEIWVKLLLIVRCLTRLVRIVRLPHIITPVAVILVIGSTRRPL
jgi:hypothetical protein